MSFSVVSPGSLALFPIPLQANRIHTKCFFSLAIYFRFGLGIFPAQSRWEEPPLLSDLLQISDEDEVLASLQLECS